MKVKKLLQVALIGVSVTALVACSTGRNKQKNMASNGAGSSYESDVRASGVGEEARFGSADDNGNSRGRVLAKRTYYFDFDSNLVHEEDKPAIKANANYLLGRQKAKVMLEGHTDPRGSREYNIGLGERRSKAVAEMLATSGVSPSQIRLVSYGAEKPASRGHTEADYKQDRRVTLVYLQR